MTTTNYYKLSMSTALDLAFIATNFIVVPNKRRSCNLLFAFSVSLCLCRKASAVRHPVDCGLYSVLRRGAFAPTNCLLFSTGWSLIVRAGNKEKNPTKFDGFPLGYSLNGFFNSIAVCIFSYCHKWQCFTSHVNAQYQISNNLRKTE